MSNYSKQMYILPGKHLDTVILIIFFLLIGIETPTIQHSVAQTSTSISGVIIPLYSYPGATWTKVASSKDAHPNVPIFTIINPNSGPGYSKDTNYVNGINYLRSHHVSVIGYVYTSYASRPLQNVEKDINAYFAWYPNLNGIMFDEMSNVAGHENYYWTLTNYVISLRGGYAFTVGNPGADTLPSYVGTVNAILIYERQGYPSLNFLDGWHSQYSKYKWGMTSYGTSLSDSFVSSAKRYTGFIYITNDVLPNPYDTLPSYFDRLIQDLD